jgi:hypothetical protein
MGKKIIIKDADFSVNGIKDNYNEYKIPSVQGIVYFTGGDAGKIYRSNTYHSRYVHSGDAEKSIVLHPGDTLAVTKCVDANGVEISDWRTAIIYYSSVVDSVYPANETPTVNNTSVSPGTYVGNVNGTNWKTYKNTSNSDRYVIIQNFVVSGSLSISAVPYLYFRVYSDDLSKYPDPEEYNDYGEAKEQNLDWEDNGGSENSGSNWDDNTGGGTEVEEDSGEGANDSEGA